MIIKLLTGEIERFSANLIQGEGILEKYLEENRQNNSSELSGEQVFKLYDTYGFPPELTNAVAKENSFKIDMAGFEKEMEKQQKQSGKKDEEEETQLKVDDNISTDFQGYEKLETTTTVTFIQKDGNCTWVVTKESPFYVESGGQVSDTGWLKVNDKVVKVLDFKKAGSTNMPAIAVKVAQKDVESLKVGDLVTCIVDAQSRFDTQKNHTATHMLQAALVQMLGKHIKQAGSLVDSKHLRFDFTNPDGLSKEQIAQIETVVNNKIQENIKLDVSNTTLAKATEAGVTAFFGEKYNPGNVRVVNIPGFSAELCGGTHLKSTGQIGCFKIISDVALSAGVRRITGVTGPRAIKLFQQSFNITKKLGEKFKVKVDQILPALAKQEESLQAALSQIKQLKKQMWKTQVPTWQQQVAQVGKTPFLFLEIENVDAGEFKNICQAIEQKSPGCYLLLITNEKTPDKINFFGYVSKKWSEQVNLKELGKLLSDKFKFRGGGSATMIQGGSNNVDFKKVKAAVQDWLNGL